MADLEPLTYKLSPPSLVSDRLLSWSRGPTQLRLRRAVGDLGWGPRRFPILFYKNDSPASGWWIGNGTTREPWRRSGGLVSDEVPNDPELALEQIEAHMNSFRVEYGLPRLGEIDFRALRLTLSAPR